MTIKRDIEVKLFIWCKEQGLEYVSDKQFKVGGKRVYASRFDKCLTKNKMFELCPDAESKLFIMEEGSKDIALDIGEMILSKLLAKKVEEKKANQQGFSYAGFQIAIDYITGDMKIFNPDTKECLGGDVDTWLKQVARKERELLLETSITGAIHYIPSNTSKVIKGQVDGQDIPVFNTYVAPLWENNYTPLETPPKDFEDYMTKFIPDERCRNYVYFWLKNMVRNRNEDILLLHGIEGAGKGLLVEVASRLIGERNFFRTEQNFFASRFNQELADRKLVFFDELNMREHRAKRTLKDMSNGYLKYEAKGKTPYNKDNYASMIVANNDPRDCHIIQNDRRFSPIDIAKVNLSDQYSVDGLSSIWTKVRTDDSFIQEIYNFLMTNEYIEESWGKSFSWKGDLYKELCFTTLSQGERFLIREIENSEDEFIEVIDLVDKFKESNGLTQFKLGEDAVSELFKKYKREDGTPYGKLILVKGVQTIQILGFEKTEEVEEDYEYEL